MKLTPNQVQSLASKVLHHWMKQNLIQLKGTEAQVLQKLSGIIQSEVNKEAELERDVYKMLDDLERSNSGQFERYKMYPLLNQKLAKERKIIL